MTESKAVKKLVESICTSTPSGRPTSTMQTSWIANNAIPDPIITNKTCRSLVPPDDELNEPNVRSSRGSTEVASGLSHSTSKNLNTLRILNTIEPVTRVFTAIDAAKPVRDLDLEPPCSPREDSYIGLVRILMSLLMLAKYLEAINLKFFRFMK